MCEIFCDVAARESNSGHDRNIAYFLGVGSGLGGRTRLLQFEPSSCPTQHKEVQRLLDPTRLNQRKF